MRKIRASVVGASGYAGGEALRLLLCHPFVEVVQATSESHAGKFVYSVHPNLRKRTMLKFTSINELKEADVAFVALPHKVSSTKMGHIMKKAGKVIDKGSDFRLKRKEDYVRWYGFEHPCPELMGKFVYGIPELHREEIMKARYVAVAGCNATASILGLYPFYSNDLVIAERTVIEVKAGSSQGGNKANEGSHHPERNDVLRSYQPAGHRHMAEIMQELDTGYFAFSATSVGTVRGILMTAHLFLKEKLDEKAIWQALRHHYGSEPFIRLVKEKTGIYRYPEPKLLWGTNYCDIGFELDPGSNRLVVIAAIDNLMKGAAGQAVQCMNLMFGIEETTGLEFPGLHPV